MKKYLDYFDTANKAKREQHETFCLSDRLSCYPDITMHLALDFCFNSSQTRVPDDRRSSQEKCQDNTKSSLFDGTKPNFMKNAGRIENDQTMHIAQVDTKTYAHNETQIIDSFRPIQAGICFWEIVADYRKKYLRLQDIKVRFEDISNLDIYITSYFLVGKESNTFYPNQVQAMFDQKQDFVFEMYNDTFIYAVPKDPNNNHLQISFEIFQAEQYLYGNNYNLISQLISGVGGTILILCVVLYLDGFTTLYNYIKEQNAERKRLAQEAALLKNNNTNKANDQLANGAGKRAGDMDTQKSMDDLSDDDLGFIANGRDEAAVHEGGRQSRPGSNGSDANQVRRRHIN